MSEASPSLAFVEFVIVIYFALPAAIIWGWVRWSKGTPPRNFPSMLSLIGFALATAAGLLAIFSVLYAHAMGSFPFYEPLLSKLYRWGALLSILGTVCAIGGLWRPNPLRWHAALCAVGTLLFWLVVVDGDFTPD